MSVEGGVGEGETEHRTAPPYTHTHSRQKKMTLKSFIYINISVHINVVVSISPRKNSISEPKAGILYSSLLRVFPRVAGWGEGSVEDRCKNKTI